MLEILMNRSAPVIFYGSPLSLYSGKARSYLRKSGIPYEERLASHPDFFQKIVPQIGRFVIPVVQTPAGDLVQDTTEIIDHFEGTTDAPSVYPESPKQKITALILEMFGDEGLIRPAMHYRWNFDEDNKDFIALEFGRIFNPTGTDEEAREIAKAPMARMKALLTPLGVMPDNFAVIEAGYAELLAALNTHFTQNPYILGGKPSIADYGLYAPLYAHLARDPAPSILMKKTANRVWRWVERMTAADMDKPEFPDMADTYLDNDEIAETLLPVLSLVGTDHGPELKALVAFMNDWLDKNPTIESGAKIVPDPEKRSLGSMYMTIRGQQFTVMARHYTLWMLQRVQDAFDGLTASEQQDVLLLLEKTGLGYLITERCNRRINREGYS